MSDDDMEDYGFEYTDEDEQEEDVDVENQYYNSKGLLEQTGSEKEALKGFEEVVNMEKDKGEWGFKATKQIVKLHFRLKQVKPMLDAYRQMLTYVPVVTRNASEKKINSLLDFVSNSNDNLEMLQEFYAITLQALMEAKNDRLWFKTNLKQCQLLFDLKEYGKAHKILRELHKSCQQADGTDDLKKGTQLLEIYALEIQIYTEQKNNKKLKQLYQKALGIKSAIPHPRIMGVIRECGGKMHMHERTWDEAATDFFEAFKNYDEAGSLRRIQCLKYLVLSNMLMQSNVDPFDAQEAKPYKNDPEITAMTNLVAAYHDNDINSFERILKNNKGTILNDPFIQQYIQDLLTNIRTQVILQVIRPYTRVRIPFIASQLHIPASEVEALLVTLILDSKVAGHIDQINGVLELNVKDKDAKRLEAIDKWTNTLEQLRGNLVKKLQA